MSEGLGAVVVVGGGIVGVCTAYELRKRGADVLLIDRGEPGRGCSFGNSGALSPSSVVPLAMPGVLAAVPGMLGDADGPLYLPWRYLPRALPWLARFVWSARSAPVEAAATRLAALHESAVQRHVALAREVGVPELILQRGHLHLYPDERALSKDAAGWRLRKEHGFQFERLDRDGILALEPVVSSRYRVGIFLADHATVRNPFRYVQAILHKFLEVGGRVLRADVRALEPTVAGGWRIETTAGPQAVRQVVVAAGAWSRRLLDPLGVKLALEAQRGYHVQFRGSASPVSRTVVLADRKVFVTPMEEGVRVGGTVEIGGLESPANPRRADMLLRIARENFECLRDQPFSTWMGHRPCMPDSVPVIGPVAGRHGLWLAVGHGHLGVTDSVRTADMIASQMSGDL
ncbi:NAD(P)/FAD-dependent oxidoreductase [Paralcaligenes ureilyticus]|uniref:D-amino-acid dehydrogenase n=1 Tax=Paralcaligenes ureilyticus TaxID=627131 RepID=A0A4R3LR45_9BURK|nr:FAD-dependent oxidoreductase [Paralcaligenes ureilyticus]TCT02089.1 D-amino-acid dehydrogenase [Paralcaligenes ureilyticus]